MKGRHLNNRAALFETAPMECEDSIVGISPLATLQKWIPFEKKKKTYPVWKHSR